jgi:hypothetical protein
MVAMEQLQAEFVELTAQVTKQGEDTSSALMAVRDSLKAMATTNGQIVENMAGINKWAPAIDESIRALHKSLTEVGTRVAVLESSRHGEDEPVHLPNGHGAAIAPQGTVTAASQGRAPALAKGTRIFHNSPILFDLGGADDEGDTPRHATRIRQHNSRPPKSDFPKFDGENPKWWKKNCEKYFHLYDVDHETWASYATMHFVGNAALWLQNVEAEDEVETWEELCVAVHAKFGKDKHHRALEALE